MTALVIAFPIARNRAEIEKTAKRMSRLGIEQAEIHIRDRLARMKRSLEKKGFGSAIVASELANFEGGVRASLWQRYLCVQGSVDDGRA